MKRTIIALLFLPAVALAEIPTNIVSYYETLFPGTARMNIVAATTNNGIAYCQIYGEGKAQDCNTSAILSVDPDGKITYLDAGHPSGMDPDPCYVISDPVVWKALQANFVERQTRQLGKSAIQESLNNRPSLSYFMAQSYKDAGYTIPSTMRLYTNEVGTKLYQQPQ